MRTVPIRELKGVGQKRAAAFESIGLMSAEDVLSRLPRDYLDYSHITNVDCLCGGENVAVKVRLTSAPRCFRKGTLSMLSVSAEDETGKLTLKWFNQPYRSAQVREGETIVACGRVEKKRGTALLNPMICAELPGILPVYATTRDLPQRVRRSVALAALETCFDSVEETLPESVRTQYGLCARNLAIRHAHFPASMEALELARRRVSFEDALLYLIVVELQKSERQRCCGARFETEGVFERFETKLPFPLTGAQRRAILEIAADMNKPAPMNRLLQGDVGSGKTAVALYALCVAAANGRQGALLAPTEILAEQHFDSMRRVFGSTVELLVGGMKKSARDEAKRRVESGEAVCVVGTHALLSGDVRFHDLGVVVTDEQHRFGVQQRALMQEKGTRPDVLVMSATPIPRTLSLILFGDLDVSVLDELPPGRIRVSTSVIPEQKRKSMYDYIAKRAELGEQTYVVCPYIEQSEDADAPSVLSLYAELKKAYPDLKLGSLHGRMRPAEKNEAMQRFRDGQTRVLISTSVIEVGLHVPAASIMVIEGAERFGLSQLHQLRGRVGRGETKSYCFLLAGNARQTENERMRILESTSDGFEIAERDLALRGPGDFIGLRQHGGEAEMISAMDIRLLEEVKRAAEDVCQRPNDENNRLIELALERFGEPRTSVAMN